MYMIAFFKDYFLPVYNMYELQGRTQRGGQQVSLPPPRASQGGSAPLGNLPSAGRDFASPPL